MIVDDEKIITEGLERILGNQFGERFTIETFHDSVDAVERATVLVPDLIILDIYMPMMNGIEVIQSLQEIGKTIQFIILTAHDDFALVRKALQFRVVDYLLKPVNRDELIALVDRIATRQCKDPEATESLPGIDFQNIHEESREYSRSMKKVISYIRLNYRDQISLNIISDATGLHPSYISSIFKKEVGLNFHAFLENLRVTMGARLLLREDSCIADIAERVGYSNVQHFHKVFKHRTGFSPGKYRLRYRKVV